jgi:hypothetical protein
MTQAILPSTDPHTYVQRVDALYSDVRKWMAVLEPDAVFTETPIELEEAATGKFTVNILNIRRAERPSISLVPIAVSMLGAEGWVDARGLGDETLLWVKKDGPSKAFLYSPGERPMPIGELYGAAQFPGTPEGWAWMDDHNFKLEHLDLAVFRDRILRRIGE